MKQIFFTLIIGMLIGGSFIWNVKPDKKCPEIAGTTIDSIEVPVVHDSLIYKAIIVPKLKDVNVDSIYQAAKKYWEQFYDNNVPVDFVAQVDTVFNDSLLSGKIGFVSRIPIDPIGYFKTDLKVKERIVTNNIFVEKEESFWSNRFIPYLGLGLGYNGKTVEPNLQIGFGVRIN